MSLEWQIHPQAEGLTAHTHTHTEFVYLQLQD